MSHQEITLGEHQASFDEATGTLSLFDDKQLVHLSADETYRLLIWLNDNYHERLHTRRALSQALLHQYRRGLENRSPRQMMMCTAHNRSALDRSGQSKPGVGQRLRRAAPMHLVEWCCGPGEENRLGKCAALFSLEGNPTCVTVQRERDLRAHDG